MAKARARKPKTLEKPIVEEQYFRSESAYLCLIINRRAKRIRVIDFRAGALPAKRLYIQSVAKREGIEKVITLVEKDEVSSWTRVGFHREGTIPGFYKRSDGHLCGCVIGDKTLSISVTDASQRLTDRTINAAKKAAKDFPDTIRAATTYEIEEHHALEFRDEAVKHQSAFHTFDDFGRDAKRIYYQVTMKNTATNVVSAEFQDCFGHSLIEVLYAPETDDEIKSCVAALRAIGDDLTARGIVSAFVFAPNDDVATATTFVAAGYRKTGLLARGIEFHGEWKDAVLWTRKLANPAGEDYD